MANADTLSLAARMGAGRPPTFSFEVFPAKTPEGHEKLVGLVGELCALRPDFISCTYGAGGGSRERTFDVVERIQKQYGVPAVAHLTCVGHSRADIAHILDDLDRRGIRNILALRGDPPAEGEPACSAPDCFAFAHELVQAIRARFGASACIGVAGFPEKHPLAPDADADARFLKHKMDAGADFVITQLFFDPEMYRTYVARLRALGVTARIIPGVLPVVDFRAVERFCARCGAGIPPAMRAVFEPIADDPERTRATGVEFTVRLCRTLLDAGAPGIHLYTLNKREPARTILAAVRPLDAPAL